jgi:HAD superfamily hydrolase (TIGR01450 family)
MALSPLLDRYDNVLLDLDGCVWLGDQCTPGAPEAVAQLRSAGKAVAFLTNDAQMMPEDYVRKLWALGVQAGLEEVVTAGSALQHVLADRHPPTAAYVIGSDAVFRHVSDAGCRIVNHSDRATEADVVVVAGHDELRFAELRDATRALLNGAELLSAGRDPVFPDGDGMSPGTGAVTAALEYAAGKTARSVGKPDPQIFKTTLDRLGPGRALMIGDRIEADLLGAAAAGIDGAIVLTGVATRADAEAATDPAPVAIAATLHELVVAG